MSGILTANYANRSEVKVRIGVIAADVTEPCFSKSSYAIFCNFFGEREQGGPECIFKEKGAISPNGLFSFLPLSAFQHTSFSCTSEIVQE